MSDRPMLSRPFAALLTLALSAGTVWLVSVYVFRRSAMDRTLLAWLLGVGILLRVIGFASTPILETDYFRYLWDGAVTAHGANPFAYAPIDVLVVDEEAKLPASLQTLSEQGSEVLSQVNHGDLRTIYPPVAQAAFALAYWLRPWSLNAWRVVLLLFDLATAGLLVLLLQRLQLPLSYLVIYWWNPLFLKEIYNSGHMDAIVLPFVLGALYLALRRRFVWAAFWLGLAVGAKVWPVLLLPILLRPPFTQPCQLLRALLVFALVSGAMFFPIWQAGLEGDAGFTAFSQRWQMNDSAFMLILWGADRLARLLQLDGALVQPLARAITGLLLLALLLWRLRWQNSDDTSICENCLIVVAVLFLLSPVQFPWYAIWLLPLVTLRPRWSLLLLLLLLPLYYLRFFLVARGQTRLFDNGIVWLEFLPVWVLLAWEMLDTHKLRINSLAAATS
ncbi:MAG: glycosyltransferase 87 family protein [Blastocatellia bacterium]